MLKIKDNVDSKELLKFGFKWDDLGYERFCGNSKFIILVDTWESIRVLYTYESWVNGKRNFEKLQDESLVDDLIQAGLVEKVNK